jgi:flavin-dependent dehydrogenase
VEHHRTRLRSIHPSEVADRPEHVLITREGGAQAASLTARYLVDATGRRAFVSRQLGIERRRLSRQSAIVGWLRHPVSDVERTTRSKSVSDGWWYTARLPKGARVVAFHGLPAAIASLRKDPALFAARCASAQLLPYAFSPDDWLLPPRTSDASVQIGERVAGPGWLAVGDAALAFDPLSSQGVLFALYSGIRGAEAIVSCLKEPERSARSLDEYAARVGSVLRANQRARQLLYSSELRYPTADYWRQQTGSYTPSSSSSAAAHLHIVDAERDRHRARSGPTALKL